MTQSNTFLKGFAMNSFDFPQCDDSAVSSADWAEYQQWVDSVDSRCPSDEDVANAELAEAAYDWSDEAIEWEEGFHPDNLYDDDDLDPIHEDELFFSTGGQCWDE